MSDELRGGVNLLESELGHRPPEGAFDVSEASREPTDQLEAVRAVSEGELMTRGQVSKIPESGPSPESAQDSGLKNIEAILADGLGDIYVQLPLDQQPAFKIAGEVIASSVNTMIRTARLQPHVILKQLNQWLGTIPGVSVYFLQQEAKLKLDALMTYAEDHVQSSSADL